MNLISRLFRRLLGRPGPEGFRDPLYVNNRRNVDIIQQGRRDGRNNLPLSDAREMGDAETAIEREYRDRHQAALESAHGDVHDLAEQFRAVEDAQPDVRDVERAPFGGAAAAERDLGADQSVVDSRRESQLRLRDLRNHERVADREAVYPESWLMHLGIAGFVAVAEAVCNTGLWASASANGWLGGIATATGIALANVSVGVATGYFLVRPLRHLRGLTRLLAVLGIMLYSGVMLAFNLALAHLRDEASIGHTMTVTTMADGFRHPLSMTPMSAALLILGIVASVVSLWDGATLDDSLPGYGAADRAHKRARASFNTATETLRSRTVGHAEGVETQIKAIVRDMRRMVEQLRRLVVAARRRYARYETERSWCENRAKVNLTCYRTENLAMRTTDPPAHFRFFPSFPPGLDAEILADLERRLEAAIERLKQIEVRAHEILLGQPQRVAAARDRFTSFHNDALRRADAGRGDGSDTASQPQPDLRPRWES